MNDENPLLAMLMGGGDPAGDPSGMGGMSGGESMPDELAMAGMPPDAGGGMIEVPVALFQELMMRAYPDLGMGGMGGMGGGPAMPPEAAPPETPEEEMPPL